MDELENALAIPREEVLLVSAKEGTGVPELLEAIVERIPPPKGDPARAAPGARLRLALRPVQGRHRLRPARERHAPRRRAHPADGVAAPRRSCSSSASSGRRSSRSRSSAPARSATWRRASRTSARRRSATRSRRGRAPAARAAARLPGGQEPRLRRHLPGQRRGLPAPARRDREAPPQRRLVHVRAGELGRARLRVPLRLPRPAPHGDRPGAPRARVLARPDRLGAVGRVRGAAGPRRAARSASTTRRSCPPVNDIEEIREPWVQLSVVTPAAYIGALMELSTNRRGPFVDLEYLDPTRVLMRFELPLAELIVDYYDQLKTRTAGLRLDGLRGDRLPGREPRPARRARRGRAGRRAVDDRPPRQRARRSAGRWSSRLRQLIPRQMFEVPDPGGHRRRTSSPARPCGR